MVDRAKSVYGTVTDATWLKSLRDAMANNVSGEAPADTCALRWRQHYYAKMVRRLIDPEN